MSSELNSWYICVVYWSSTLVWSSGQVLLCGDMVKFILWIIGQAHYVVLWSSSLCGLLVKFIMWCIGQVHLDGSLVKFICVVQWSSSMFKFNDLVLCSSSMFKFICVVQWSSSMF
jgi:hypothetical protein